MCYIFLLLAALIFTHVKMNKIYRFPLIFYREIILYLFIYLPTDICALVHSYNTYTHTHIHIYIDKTEYI